ncbi:MAG: hypothetical protein AB7Q81_02900 [Gammaproteobacteria bacterium]
MNHSPILILQTDRTRPPAAIADVLARRGYPTIACRVRDAADLPGPRLVESAGAVIVLDAARDAPAAQDDTLAWLGECRARERPLLGIGHGGELLTHLHGGALASCPPVRGWFALNLHPRAAATPWLTQLGPRLPCGLLWQERTWQPPVDALPLLAAAPDACVAWAAHGALALRVHIETTAALYAEWLASWASQPEVPALDWQDHASLVEAGTAVAAQRKLAEALLDGWLATIT